MNVNYSTQELQFRSFRLLFLLCNVGDLQCCSTVSRRGLGLVSVSDTFVLGLDSVSDSEDSQFLLETSGVKKSKLSASIQSAHKTVFPYQIYTVLFLKQYLNSPYIYYRHVCAVANL